MRLIDYFDRGAALDPDRIFLLSESSADISYKQAQERSSAIAKALFAKGIQKGDSGATLYKGAPIGPAFRKEAGIQFQVTSLQEFLTVRETLRLFKNFYPRTMDLQEVIRVCTL